MACSFMQGETAIYTNIDDVNDAIRYIDSDCYGINPACPSVCILTDSAVERAFDTGDNDYIVSVARIIEDNGAVVHTYFEQVEKGNDAVDAFLAMKPAIRELVRALRDEYDGRLVPESDYEEWLAENSELNPTLEDILDEAADVWHDAVANALPTKYEDAGTLEGFHLETPEIYY